jgi:hypothetical protein
MAAVHQAPAEPTAASTRAPRPGAAASKGIEKISFVQAYGSISTWRHIKARTYASGSTATRLCTDGMLEFLSQRHWDTHAWQRPETDGSDIQQVFIPLSNVDGHGELIVSPIYLKRQRLIELFDQDKQAFRAALETRMLGALIGLAADRLRVSHETFAFNFLCWLPSAERQRPMDCT